MTLAVELALVFQTRVTVPAMFAALAATSVEQLAGSPHFKIEPTVAPVTPPPEQPVSLAPVIEAVGLTNTLLFSAGSAGDRLAVPLIVLQVGLAAAAPACEAVNPRGSNAVHTNKTPENLRMWRSPRIG